MYCKLDVKQQDFVVSSDREMADKSKARMKEREDPIIHEERETISGRNKICDADTFAIESESHRLEPFYAEGCEFIPSFQIFEQEAL